MADKSVLPIAVSGASGKLARLTIEALLDTYGVAPDQIFAVTRSPDAISDLAARGVVVREGDYDRPDTLRPAYEGARRVHVMSTMGVRPYVDGARTKQQTAAIDAAVAVGADQIFYTSAPNPEPGTPAFWKHDHYRTELALKDCGTNWTILRHGEWPNFHWSEFWRLAFEKGRYYNANGTGGVSWVTREDHALADAAALVSMDSANKTYNFTGPEVISLPRVIGKLEKLIGKSVEIIECEPDELRPHLEELGVHEDAIPFFIDGAKAIQMGLYAEESDDIKNLTGKKLTTLDMFFSENAEAIKSGQRIP